MKATPKKFSQEKSSISSKGAESFLCRAHRWTVMSQDYKRHGDHHRLRNRQKKNRDSKSGTGDRNETNYSLAVHMNHVPVKRKSVCESKSIILSIQKTNLLDRDTRGSKPNSPHKRNPQLKFVDRPLRPGMRSPRT